MPAWPIRQIAYFVPDVRAAAARHHALFGSGPYFVAEHIPLAQSIHRGVLRELDHSSAYGQWGEVMIEFCSQNNPGPSAFRDVYPEGSDRSGLHHCALFVDSVEEAVKRFGSEGYEVALDARMMDGFRYVFVDTLASMGHMLELYEPADKLLAFYEHVGAAAGDFSAGITVDIAL
jgi:catechol 2,3-dioxygenase-like lactoylglutathione lyase family enzyme